MSQELAELVDSYKAALSAGELYKAAIIEFQAKDVPGYSRAQFTKTLQNRSTFLKAFEIMTLGKTNNITYDKDDDASVARLQLEVETAMQEPGPAPRSTSTSSVNISTTDATVGQGSRGSISQQQNVVTYDATTRTLTNPNVEGNGTEIIKIGSETFKCLKYDQIVALLPAQRLVMDCRALFTEWRDALKFRGFEPAKMATRLWKSTHIKSPAMDIIFLIVVGCERGNAVSKILKTMASGDWKDYLSQLQTLFEIKDKLQANMDAVQKANTVTLSRICMCFPTFTCEYYPFVTNPTVSWQALDDVVGRPYNKHMAHAAFASMIEKSIPDWYKMLALHMLHQVLFTYIINRNTKKTKKEVFLDCLRFTKASIDSDWVGKEHRLQSLKEWKVINANNSLASDILESYSRFVSYIGMSDDDIKNAILL